MEDPNVVVLHGSSEPSTQLSIGSTPTSLVIYGNHPSGMTTQKIGYLMVTIAVDGALHLTHPKSGHRAVRWAIFRANESHRAQYEGRMMHIMVDPHHPNFARLNRCLTDGTMSGTAFGSKLPHPSDFGADRYPDESTRHAHALRDTASTFIECATQAWAEDVYIDRRLQRLVEEWNQGKGLELTQQDLAKRWGVSSNRISHLACEQIGGFKRAQNYYRCKAAGLLRCSGQSLSTAATMAGFSDVAHLSHTFRATFNIPPTRCFGPQTLVWGARA